MLSIRVPQRTEIIAEKTLTPTYVSLYSNGACHAGFSDGSELNATLSPAQTVAILDLVLGGMLPLADPLALLVETPPA